MILSKLTLLLLFSIMYVLGLSYLYFSKTRINNMENKIYKAMLITNIVGLVLQLACDYVSFQYDNLPYLFSDFILRIYLVYFIIWIGLMFLYLIEISFKNKKKASLFIIAISLIMSIILFVLPYELYRDVVGQIYYTYGPAIDLVFIYSGIICLLMGLVVIIKHKKISKRKSIPIYILLVFGIMSAIIQKIHPELVIITEMESFLCCLMYFTIENPDMKMIAELNIARDQAEKANNAKSDFLSNMSHEIRTPLNAIVGFSQALAEEENVPEEAKDEIKDIMMASQNLLEIVNGILDISKIEANKLEIVNTEYSLNNVLEELTALTKARIGEKPITLRTTFDQSIPPVLYGDYIRLKQIVLNLLTNAAKYTKEGYIEFKVDSVKKDDICRLIISVEDTGIGIKKENIDKLFSKFERLDLEKNITIEGTGLGLAITKKLVELMNGNIVVQSEYGNGSKFTVAIDQRIVEGKEATQVGQASAELEMFDASNKRILVVDDNKINLKVAVRLLQNYNVQIDQAISGTECIDKIKQGEHYDLILLDDMMPKMSGVETLKELQKIGNYQIPTIAFTANAISGMKEKYLNDGFHDYLSKPIDKLELNKLLIKYLKEGEK